MSESSYETPQTAMDRVKKCGSALTQAELDLKRARDLEVERKHLYEAAQRFWMLNEECPPVTRGGTTTAERDAWVAEKCSDEKFQLDIAEAARQAAKDHYETVNTQSMLAMAILKSIDLAFSVSNRAN